MRVEPRDYDPLKHHSATLLCVSCQQGIDICFTLERDGETFLLDCPHCAHGYRAIIRCNAGALQCVEVMTVAPLPHKPIVVVA